MNFFRKFVLEPIRQKRRWAKIEKLNRERKWMEWGYNNRVPDKHSDVFKAEAQRLKKEIDILLIDGRTE